jgi:hypothetical protein
MRRRVPATPLPSSSINRSMSLISSIPTTSGMMAYPLSSNCAVTESIYVSASSGAFIVAGNPDGVAATARFYAAARSRTVICPCPFVGSGLSMRELSADAPEPATAPNDRARGATDFRSGPNGPQPSAGFGVRVSTCQIPNGKSDHSIPNNPGPKNIHRGVVARARHAAQAEAYRLRYRRPPKQAVARATRWQQSVPPKGCFAASS